MKRQVSQGFVQQLHRDGAAEVQPQATEVSQPGAQGPAALHERGNAGGHAGEERHLPGVPGAGGALTTHTSQPAVYVWTSCFRKGRMFHFILVVVTYPEAVREAEMLPH